MNYNTQNAKIAAISERTLVVGIDVGSESQSVREAEPSCQQAMEQVFEQEVNALL